MQVLGAAHRANALGTHGAGHLRNVNFGLAHALANPFVLGRAVALFGHALLVQLVVEERVVVAHDQQQRNAVAHRRPHGGVAHQKVAVANQGHGDTV